MKKIDVSTSILDQSGHFDSISINSKQFLHKKLLKNDVFEENLVKFGNHVETKPLEPVLWNFAWKNCSLYAFRWYKTEFGNMNISGPIKVSFVAVVIDGRVSIFVLFSFQEKLCNGPLRLNLVAQCITLIKILKSIFPTRSLPDKSATISQLR